MEIVSVCISILSLMLSLALAVRAYLEESESYSINVLDYRTFDNGATLFYLGITNHSSTPLVITSIKYNGELSRLEPTTVWGKPGHYGHCETPAFPVGIPAHGAQYAYILFHDTEVQHKLLYQGTAVTFEIQTTRKLSQKTVVLSHTGYYLHKDNFH